MVCIAETEFVYCAVRNLFCVFWCVSVNSAIISLYSIN
jgi:hypothetical protein